MNIFSEKFEYKNCTISPALCQLFILGLKKDNHPSVWTTSGQNKRLNWDDWYDTLDGRQSKTIKAYQFTELECTRASTNNIGISLDDGLLDYKTSSKPLSISCFLIMAHMYTLQIWLPLITCAWAVWITPTWIARERLILNYDVIFM